MKNETETIKIPQSFIDDFKSKCAQMPNGCISYLGAHTVRLQKDIEAGVRFLSPRRAAYLIEKKQMPTHEVKLICHTPTCVNPAHFIEGRLRNTANPTVINTKLIQQIKSETISQREIAKKYKLSRNTIAKFKKKKAD